MSDNFKNIKNGINLEPLSADPSNAKAGDIQFSDGTARAKGLHVFKDSAWSEAGGGGGGGLDVFHTEDFETATSSSNFTTGNDAAPDAAGTGTLNGAVADETSSPISKTTSIKYTMGSSSTNDFFIIDTDITIDIKQAGNPIGINFYYKYNGANGDVKVIILDQDDLVLSDSLDLLDAASNSTRFSTSVELPIGTTGLRYGFQVVTGNNTKVLTFDDIELSVDPFVVLNLDNITPWESYTPVTQGLGTVSNVAFNFRRVGDSIEVEGFLTAGTVTAAKLQIGLPSGLVINDTDLTNKSSLVGIGRLFNAAQEFDNSARELVGFIDSTENLTSVGFAHKATSVTQVSADLTNAFIASSSSQHYAFTVPIVGFTASSEHVVTPARSTLTDWIDFTPTASTGYGTITNQVGKYRRVGNTMHVVYGFTVGTVTSANATIDLPSGFNIDTSQILGADRNTLGWLHRVNGTSEIDTSSFIHSYNGSDTDKVYVVRAADANDSLDYTEPVNTGVTAGDGILGEFIVPIQGWTSDVTFLAAVPVQRIVYLRDEKSSATAGGTFTLGVYRTRDLNVVEGDTDLVTLSSNQFILQAGKYAIEATTPAHDVDNHKAKLRNITDSSDVIIGTSAKTAASENEIGHSFIKGSFTIASTKTFEIQHRSSATKATSGFGETVGFGDVEVYTIVKITKLK